jgi:hypothetical protein
MRPPAMSKPSATCELFRTSTHAACGRPGYRFMAARAIHWPWAPFTYCRDHRNHVMRDLAEQGFQMMPWTWDLATSEARWSGPDARLDASED